MIYWSYSNLAMAHSAVEREQEKYGTFNYIIRAKLFKGLKDGTMNIRSIFDDEKIKLNIGMNCNYCGSSTNLSLDHILPQKSGGSDKGDNLIYACRKCNSSKGKKDLLEWMDYTNRYLPLMVIRRYLKLVHSYCQQEGLLNSNLDELDIQSFPFRLDLLPTKYPKPNLLQLNIEKKR